MVKHLLHHKQVTKIGTIHYKMNTTRPPLYVTKHSCRGLSITTRRAQLEGYPPQAAKWLSHQEGAELVSWHQEAECLSWFQEAECLSHREEAKRFKMQMKLQLSCSLHLHAPLTTSLEVHCNI